jgi:hypothetical protein
MSERPKKPFLGCIGAFMQQSGVAARAMRLFSDALDAGFDARLRACATAPPLRVKTNLS